MMKRNRKQKWIFTGSMVIFCLLLFFKRLTGEGLHVALGILWVCVTGVHVWKAGSRFRYARGSVRVVDMLMMIAFFVVLVSGVLLHPLQGRPGILVIHKLAAVCCVSGMLVHSMRGLDETIQYDKGKERMEQMNERSRRLGWLQKKLNRNEARQNALTNLVILLFSFGMLFFILYHFRQGSVTFGEMLIATIAMMGSFGPVVALSNLSNNLNQTLAAGERVLFHDTIAANIAVGKPGAALEEIMEAAKKASIHDFIMTLPAGYETQVGELGDTLSGGEKQRIGIARAFLHDSPFLLLDEPTSNLDSLNEGIIIKSLLEVGGEKTVVLVSHRKSTLNFANVIYEMEGGR